MKNIVDTEATGIRTVIAVDLNEDKYSHLSAVSSFTFHKNQWSVGMVG